jgi:transcriptional regulator with PAS, ATPase and Fis domain
VTKKGKRIPISVSTALLVDGRGRVLGGAETFRDLSELEELKKELASRGPNPVFRSKSPSMEKLLAMLPAVSDSTSSILIQGETGTGKEVLARTIHALSPRKEGPFVAVNCGAIPESLLESELFGYKKGAFTGADRDKPGRFALAEGGTLFLDEIGDISSALQVKLLRVLQEREYEPLGGTKPVRADVRLVSATNADLSRLISDGKFRKDLFYRINVINLPLPPLKERKEDIPDLASGFLVSFAAKMNKKIDGFAPEVFSRFYAYDWPGNIRELENIVERMVVLADSPVIGRDLLPAELTVASVSVKEAMTGDAHAKVSLVRDEAERECILAALQANGWKRADTAASLGMDKATLWRKMKKLGITKP